MRVLVVQEPQMSYLSIIALLNAVLDKTEDLVVLTHGCLEHPPQCSHEGELSRNNVALRMLGDLCKKKKVMMVLGSVEEKTVEPTGRYDTSVVFDETGEICFRYRCNNKRPTGKSQSAEPRIFQSPQGPIGLFIGSELDVRAPGNFAEMLQCRPVLIIHVVREIQPRKAYPDIQSQSRELVRSCENLAFGCPYLRVDWPYPTGMGSSLLKETHRTILAPTMNRCCFHFELSAMGDAKLPDMKRYTLRTLRADDASRSNSSYVAYTDDFAMCFLSSLFPQGGLVVSYHESLRLWNLEKHEIVAQRPFLSTVRHIAVWYGVATDLICLAVAERNSWTLCAVEVPSLTSRSDNIPIPHEGTVVSIHSYPECDALYLVLQQGTHYSILAYKNDWKTLATFAFAPYVFYTSSLCVMAKDVRHTVHRALELETPVMECMFVNFSIGAPLALHYVAKCGMFAVYDDAIRVWDIDRSTGSRLRTVCFTSSPGISLMTHLQSSHTTTLVTVARMRKTVYLSFFAFERKESKIKPEPVRGVDRLSRRVQRSNHSGVALTKLFSLDDCYENPFVAHVVTTSQCACVLLKTGDIMHYQFDSPF